MTGIVAGPTPGVERRRLPSGLQLVVRSDRRLPVAAFRVYVRGGSMAEAPPGGGGIAHLVEHRLGSEAAEPLSRDGILVNAFTARDLTCYRWHALREDGAASLRRLLEVLAGVPLPASWLEVERRVVLEEVALATARPLSLLRQKALDALFPDHPFRHPVGGTPEGLASLGSADLEGYRGRQYGGTETVIAVAGDLDADELAQAVAGVELPRGGEAPLATVDGGTLVPPPAAASREITVAADGDDDEWSLVAYATPGTAPGARGDRSVAALELLAARLGSPHPAGLLHRLHATEGVRQVAVRLAQTPYGAGWLTVTARHRAGQGAALGEVVLDHLDAVASGRRVLPPPEAHRPAPPVGTLDAWCEFLGEGEARHGDPLHAFIAEGTEEPTEDEMAAAAERCLRRERGVAARIQTPRPRARRRRQGRPARNPAARVLDNGLSLLVLPTSHPRASCQLLLRGGVAADAEAGVVPGVCSLLARTLPQAPPPPVRRALEEHRAEGGDDVFAFCDANFYGLSATTRGDRVGSLASLLHSVAARPALSEVALRREAEHTADWLQARRLRWDEAAHSALRRLLYRRSPYGWEEIGTPEALRNVRPADVEACRHRTWTGGNGAVVVSGNVDPEAVLDQLAAAFETVPAGPALSAPPPEPEATAPRRSTLRQPAGTSTVLAMGFAGLPWDRRRHAARDLLKALVVGPRNDSVSGTLLREARRRGLSYAVQWVDQPGFDEGYLAVLAACSQGSEGVLEELVVEELDRIRRGELEEAELAPGRKATLLDHLLLAEDPRLHAYTAGRQVLFAGDLEAWQQVPGDLETTGPDDVVRLVRDHLTPRRRATVISTPAGGDTATSRGQGGRG